MPYKITLATIFAASAALPLHARAANVACGASGQTITAAINALKPAIGYQTINVSGKCVENVYVPANVSVALVAAAGTTLTPANSNAAISVNGKLIVNNLSISTGSFAGIYVNQGGYVNLQGGTITGPGNGLQVTQFSGALVQNTVFTTSGPNAAISISFGSLEIDGVSKFLGRNSTSITDSKGSGINCNNASVLLATYTGGTVVFTGNGGNGLYIGSGCSLTVAAGSASEPVTIEKTGITGSFSSAISISGGGAAVLAAVHIVDNTGYGINAAEGASVQIAGVGTEITGNAGLAIFASNNAIIHLVPYHGINTISNPAGNTNPLFNCYQGGKIYVDQIAGTITPAPTSADIGCLTVGGP